MIVGFSGILEATEIEGRSHAFVILLFSRQVQVQTHVKKPVNKTISTVDFKVHGTYKFFSCSTASLE